MRVEEAREISRLVLEKVPTQGAICLNIGSSTKYFREEMQPHVNGLLIAPLEKAGVKFVHCDMKSADGVDMVGDVLSSEYRARLQSFDAGLLLCCNILEHLVEPQVFCDACAELVRPGGYMVVSVPYSYPYHADPIDTMLRPSPADLRKFFPGWKPVSECVVVSTNYWQDLMATPGGVKTLLKHILVVLMPLYRRSQWRGKAHRLMWLFRKYKVTLILLQKPA